MRVAVGAADCLLAYKSVVIHQQSCRTGIQLERNSGLNVIKHIPEEVHRPSENRLRTITTMERIHPAVPINANVADAAVRLYEVVVEHMQIVVVDIDRSRLPVRIGFRRAIGRDSDSVMEV